MRAREIILELREYMNRDEYGAWVNAKTKRIYEVDLEEHEEVMDLIAQVQGIEPDDAYMWGYANHFVRVAFGRRHEINISGIYTDINAAAQILLATCVQPDVKSVYIDYYKVPEDAFTAPSMKNFKMPIDRRELMMFIKGETE